MPLFTHLEILPVISMVLVSVETWTYAGYRYDTLKLIFICFSWLFLTLLW